MAGGDQPIHDGDWVLMPWARGESLQSVLGRVALVRHSADETDAPAYFLKRVVETEEGYALRSHNPSEDDIPASEDTVVVALLVDVLPPDTTATAQTEPFVEALLDAMAERLPEQPSAYNAAFKASFEAMLQRVVGGSSLEALLADDDRARAMREALAEWVAEETPLNSQQAMGVIKDVGQ
jgi:hypothetical protein